MLVLEKTVEQAPWKMMMLVLEKTVEQAPWEMMMLVLEKTIEKAPQEMMLVLEKAIEQVFVSFFLPDWLQILFVVLGVV